MTPVLHPALLAAADAAVAAYRDGRTTHDRTSLGTHVAEGADETPSLFVDVLVEAAVLDALHRHDVNVLSEEVGWIDGGHVCTVVMDPVDGSSNAAAGVPIAAFSAALAVDGRFTEGLTVWLHTDERFWARADRPSGRTTGRTRAEGALVSMLRPHERNLSAWLAVARRTGKLRVLGSTTLESAFVAAGALDAFIDPGSDTHRLVDLAAAVVLLEAAGGAVVDALGRPIEFDIDLTRRWSGIAAATPALAAELADLVAETLEPAAG